MCKSNHQRISSSRGSSSSSSSMVLNVYTMAIQKRIVRSNQYIYESHMIMSGSVKCIVGHIARIGVSAAACRDSSRVDNLAKVKYPSIRPSTGTSLFV